MSATNPPTLQGVSPGKLRRELETLVINDLLGPAAGPVEEVDEKTPITDRYLFGKLAPRDQEISRDQGDDLAGATVRRLLNLYQASLIHQIRA